MPPVVLTVLPDLPVPAVTGLQLRVLALLQIVHSLGAESHAIFFGHDEPRGEPEALLGLCQSVVAAGVTRPYEAFGIPRRVVQRGRFVTNALLRRVGSAYPFSLSYDAIGGADAVRTEAARVEAQFVILPTFLAHWSTGLRRDGRRVVLDAVDAQAIQAWNLLRTYGPRRPHKLPGLIANFVAARSQERLLLPQADEIWANSAPQAEELRRIAPETPVVVIGNVLDEREIAGSELPGERRVGFIGNYGYTPNLDGATHLVEGVLPRLRARVPDVRLAIAGPGLPAETGERWNAVPGAEILGRVDDASAFLRSCRALGFPLYFESGPPLKVVEALAHGRPIVVSPQIATALELRDRLDALVARDDAEAAELLADVLTDDALAEELSAAGRVTFEARFSLRSAVAQARRHSVLASHLPASPAEESII